MTPNSACFVVARVAQLAFTCRLKKKKPSNSEVGKKKIKRQDFAGQKQGGLKGTFPLWLTHIVLWLSLHFCFNGQQCHIRKTRKLSLFSEMEKKMISLQISKMTNELDKAVKIIVCCSPTVSHMI